MKRIIIMAAAMFVAFGCSKSEEITLPVECGEKVSVDASSTRVTLDDESAFTFESGDEIQIYAKTTKALSSLSNSLQDFLNKFFGSFGVSLPADKETFLLFYPNNATYVNGSYHFEQTGKPWLTSEKEDVTRDELTNQYCLTNVTFAQPADVNIIAIRSDYDATIKFTTIAGESIAEYSSAATVHFSGYSDTTMNITAGDVAFVNVPDLANGFKLDITVAGEGTMYKSYGFTSGITANAAVTLKKADFRGVGVELAADDASLYTSYTGKNNSLDGSKIYFTSACGGKVAGMSQTLYDSTVMESGICYGKADDIIENYATLPTVNHSGTSFTIAAAEPTLAWGAYKVCAYVKLNTDAMLYSSPREVYVTGIPYTAAPPTAADGWSISDNASFNGSYLQLGGGTGNGSATKSFYVPAATSIGVTFTNVEMNSTALAGTSYAPKLEVSVGGNTVLTKDGPDNSGKWYHTDASGKSETYGTLVSSAGDLTPSNMTVYLTNANGYKTANVRIRMPQIVVEYR